MAIASPIAITCPSFSHLSSVNSTPSVCRYFIITMRYEYALNIEGLKAGSVYMYALNSKYVLKNRVRLTTRVYGILYEIMCLIRYGSSHV